MYEDDHKERILEILRTKYNGNVYQCSKDLNLNRMTLSRWYKADLAKKEEELSATVGVEQASDKLIMSLDTMKDMIFKRLLKVIPLTNDPKKLVETYKLLVDFENTGILTEKKDFWQQLKDIINEGSENNGNE